VLVIVSIVDRDVAIKIFWSVCACLFWEFVLPGGCGFSRASVYTILCCACSAVSLAYIIGCLNDKKHNTKNVATVL